MVRDEQHRRLALQLVDRLREAARRSAASRLLVASSKIRILRPLEQRAGDGEALLLAAGQADAVLADLGLVALRQLLDRRRGSRPSCRRDDHLLEAGVRVAP